MEGFDFSDGGIVALITLVATAAIGFGWKYLKKFVKGTENKYDDAFFAAVEAAVKKNADKDQDPK